jgi:ankyrin repeat protein
MPDNAESPIDPDALQRLPEGANLPEGWPGLQAFLTRFAPNPPSLVADFIDAALSDLPKAEALMATHPNIIHGGFHVDLVLGNTSGAVEFLAEFPALAVTPGGPRNWEPLLYVCFSRYAGGSASRGPAMVEVALVETAQVLLRHGANANATYIHKDWPDSPLSCLYGATGLNNNPALGLVLLQAGANPNDGESVYHSTEHADLACLRLLLAHGAKAGGTNVLPHMLDREDLTGLQRLLAAGADPNDSPPGGGTALHWAVFRRRSAPILTALLDAGVAIDARRADGRTAYALAIQTGQMESAALLRARGAETALSALDRFLGECAAASPEELDRLLAAGPKPAVPEAEERLLPDLAQVHSVAGVRALLAAGVPVTATGDMGATALHWACWHGYADLVAILLAHGAPIAAEDAQFHGVPAGWFCHGLQNCNSAGSDYAEVARLLIGAGAVIPKDEIPTGNAAVDAVLREHGLL